MNKTLRWLIGAAACTGILTSISHAQTKAQIVAASQKAVNYIINDTKRFNGDNCFSCHNSGQAIRAGLMAEKSPDLSVDQAQLNFLINTVNRQQYTSGGFWDGAITHVGSATNAADFSYTTSSWALFSQLGVEPGNTATPYSQASFIRGASFIERILAMTPSSGIPEYGASAAGVFPADHISPPVDTGNPGETARAIMILARAKQLDGQAHWTTQIDRAVAYLKTVTPSSSSYIQDAAWIVMALKAAGLPNSDPKIAAMISLIKGRQHADGGWSLNSNASVIAGSDAFGTGVALAALLAIGETNSSSYPDFREGVTWLLGRQLSDGSWASVNGSSPVSSSTWAVLSLTELAATPPTVNVPGDITVEATSAAGAVVTYSVSAVDDNGAAVPVTSLPASGSVFPIGTTTVSATATINGLTTTSTFKVIVRDSTRPVIGAIADQVLEATGPSGAVATYSATATDAISGSLPVSFDPASGSTFPIRLNFVTATATDAAGNTASSIFSIKVQDTTPPVISAQADITADATSAAGASVSYSASATDLVSGPLGVTAAPSSGSLFPVGTSTVTLTAQDAAGNVATSTFSVTVRDVTPPVIHTPAPIVLEATSAIGASASFSASATDDVSGPLGVTASPASGAIFPLGTSTVTLTAKDAAGNVATSTFTVTVKDTTAPVIAGPGNLTAEATGPAGASVSFSASATDIVSGAVGVTASPASGAVFPLGTSTVTLTAKDAAGNIATSTFTVTVKDTTAPVIAGPGNLTAEATGPAGASVSFSASAADLVSGALGVTASPASGTVFPLGTSTVTLRSVDAAGNVGTSTFTVTVKDTTAPVISAPADIVLEATGAAGAIATFSASATDLVSGATAVTASPASGSLFAIGTTTVTLRSVDAAGNQAAKTFTVTVRDTTAPSFTALTPSSATLWPPNHQLVPITLTAQASDTVGIASLRIVSVTSSEPDNGLGDGDTPNDIQITGPLSVLLRAERAGNGNGRTYTITVEAADAAGNKTTRTTTVGVPKSQGGKK